MGLFALVSKVLYYDLLYEKYGALAQSRPVLAIVLFFALRGGLDPAPGPAEDDEDRKVTLVDAGREPRSPLRYRLKAGTMEKALSTTTASTYFKFGETEIDSGKTPNLVTTPSSSRRICRLRS